HRQTSLRRRLEGFDGGGPVDGAVVGREVLVLFAVIVVEVDGRNKIAQRRETFLDARVLRKVGEVCVANIKVEAHSGTAVFVDENTEIIVITHLKDAILHTNP